MTAWIEFLKRQYRNGNITDADLENIYIPKGIKGNNKLSTEEKNAIKGYGKKGKSNGKQNK